MIPKKDSLIYKYKESQKIFYNGKGNETRRIKYNINGLKEKLIQKNGATTFLYKNGILEKVVWKYDEFNDELLFDNSESKLSVNFNNKYDLFSLIEYDYKNRKLKLVPNVKNDYWGVSNSDGAYIEVVYNEFNRLKQINWNTPDNVKITGFEFRYNENEDVVESVLNAYENEEMITEYKKRVYEYVYDEKNNWVQQIQKHYKMGKLKSVEIVEREIEYY